jgi:hypothetical protein
MGTYNGNRNEKGLAHGKGTITYDDGEKYEGEWKEGNRHGKGTYTFETGYDGLIRFEGEWQENKPFAGVFTFSNNGTISGEFTGYHYNEGNGKIDLKDGRIFEGKWSGLDLILTDNDNDCFLTPRLNSCFIAQAFESEKSIGEHLFVAESNKYPYRVIQADKQIHELIAATKFDEALLKVEEVKNLYLKDLCADDPCILFIANLVETIKECKRVKLQEDILSTFGQGQPSPKTEPKPKTDDDFDDFA